VVILALAELGAFEESLVHFRLAHQLCPSPDLALRIHLATPTVRGEPLPVLPALVPRAWGRLCGEAAGLT
jgi:hypothetical protein